MLTRILLTTTKEDKELLETKHKATSISRNKYGAVIGVKCACGANWMGYNSFSLHEIHQAEIIAKKRGW